MDRTLPEVIAIACNPMTTTAEFVRFRRLAVQMTRQAVREAISSEFRQSLRESFNRPWRNDADHRDRPSVYGTTGFWTGD